MIRYALFAGDEYYPGRGWEDFRQGFETLEDARTAAAAIGEKEDWWQIVDIHELKVVEFRPTQWISKRPASTTEGGEDA